MAASSSSHEQEIRMNDAHVFSPHDEGANYSVHFSMLHEEGCSLVHPHPFDDGGVGLLNSCDVRGLPDESKPLFLLQLGFPVAQLPLVRLVPQRFGQAGLKVKLSCSCPWLVGHVGQHLGLGLLLLLASTEGERFGGFGLLAASKVEVGFLDDGCLAGGGCCHSRRVPG